jgi:hypothetical protein
MLGHSDTGGPERCQACQPWPVAGEVAPTRPVGLPPARSACHLAALGLVRPRTRGSPRIRHALRRAGPRPRRPTSHGGPGRVASPACGPAEDYSRTTCQTRDHRASGHPSGALHKPQAKRGPQGRETGPNLRTTAEPQANLRTTGQPPANLRTTAARTHHQRPADVGPRGTKTSPSAGNPGRHGTRERCCQPVPTWS